jgi:hypothetical protein
MDPLGNAQCVCVGNWSGIDCGTCASNGNQCSGNGYYNPTDCSTCICNPGWTGAKCDTFVSAFQQFNGFDIKGGGEERHSIQASKGNCEAVCKDWPWCMAYTWDNSGSGNCWIKAGIDGGRLVVEDPKGNGNRVLGNYGTGNDTNVHVGGDIDKCRSTLIARRGEGWQWANFGGDYCTLWRGVQNNRYDSGIKKWNN